MKVSMVHDQTGNISSIVAYPDDAPAPGAKLAEGEQITSADVADLSLELGEAAIHERLADMQANYRVDLSTNMLAKR